MKIFSLSSFKIDQSIYNIAYKKKKITDDFFRILKESAIDCNLNANQNEDINCFSYSSKVTPNDYSYIPDIKIDEGSAFIQTQQKITEIQGRKIQYKSKYYILSQDNMVYDYEMLRLCNYTGMRFYDYGILRL